MTAQQGLGIRDIVNVEHYPLDGTNPPALQSVVEKFRTQLRTELYCTLPNFITGPTLNAMADEARLLQGAAYHNNSLRNCYLHQQLDADLNASHARNLQDRSSTRMIAYDQLPHTSPLKAFYHHPAIRSLVAEIVNEGELFENNDAYQPANYVCYQDGDESSWHFDADNSFTMTLMIQAADHGGEFEMSPHTRTDNDENYVGVAKVLRGEHAGNVHSIAREPAALCIFRGCNSLHRVTPVRGDSLRIMGVFVYEFSPGQVGDPRVNETIYGPRVAS